MSTTDPLNNNLQESRVIRDVMNRIQSELQQAGIEPVLETRRMLMEVLHCTPLDLFMRQQEELDEVTYRRLSAIVKRRTHHEPLQYIFGTTGFMGFDFFCREGTLIPRFDTENLVTDALGLMENRDRIKVLDLCTGSGCIGISFQLLREKKGHGEDLVICSDISDTCLELARKNAEALHARVRILKSDLFSEIADSDFDLIISNPPYIPTEDVEDLMPEVRDYEPVLALDGKQDGLYFYRRILNEISDHVKPGGWVDFEIGSDQAEPVSDLMKAHGLREIAVKKDLQGLDRVIHGRI